jgi:hypothetical protein
LVLQLYLLGLVLYRKHVHKKEGVPHRLRSSMVVEIHPNLGGFQFCLFDARHPGLQLHLLAEIVVWSWPTRRASGSLSELLQTVEINSTFYRPPGELQVQSWIKKAKDLNGFEYSVKVPQLVTHKALVEGDPGRAIFWAT